MIPTEELSISQAHSAFRDGTYTSKELTKASPAGLQPLTKLV
jgi:hypothetical protein